MGREQIDREGQSPSRLVRAGQFIGDIFRGAREDLRAATEQFAAVDIDIGEGAARATIAPIPADILIVDVILPHDESVPS
jgi:hypothetical protein